MSTPHTPKGATKDAVLALAPWAQHRNTCGVFAEPGTGGKPQGCTCGLQEAAQDAIEAAERVMAQRNRANARANSTEVLLSKQKFKIESLTAQRDEALRTVGELREARPSFFSDVVEWDKATGGAASLDLRVVCMEEEWTELHEAMESGDVAQVAKEAADVVWTVLALAWGYDVPFDAVWTEVVRSNFSKVGPNGETHRRADGKIVKPPNYSPPDLSFVAPRVPGAEGS